MSARLYVVSATCAGQSAVSAPCRPARPKVYEITWLFFVVRFVDSFKKLSFCSFRCHVHRGGKLVEIVGKHVAVDVHRGSCVPVPQQFPNRNDRLQLFVKCIVLSRARPISFRNGPNAAPESSQLRRLD